MTTTAHSGKEPGRFRMFIGHYAFRILLLLSAVPLFAYASMAVMMLTDRYSFWLWVGDILVFYYWFFVPAATVVPVLISVRTHSTNLCLRCIGIMPLDPESDVTKYRPVLKLYHVLIWYYAAYVIALITMHLVFADIGNDTFTYIGVANALVGMLPLYAIIIHGSSLPWIIMAYCGYMPTNALATPM